MVKILYIEECDIMQAVSDEIVNMITNTKYFVDGVFQEQALVDEYITFETAFAKYSIIPSRIDVYGRNLKADEITNAVNKKFEILTNKNLYSKKLIFDSDECIIYSKKNSVIVTNTLPHLDAIIKDSRSEYKKIDKLFMSLHSIVVCSKALLACMHGTLTKNLLSYDNFNRINKVRDYDIYVHRNYGVRMTLYVDLVLRKSQNYELSDSPHVPFHEKYNRVRYTKFDKLSMNKSQTHCKCGMILCDSIYILDNEFTCIFCAHKQRTPYRDQDKADPKKTIYPVKMTDVISEMYARKKCKLMADISNGLHSIDNHRYISKNDSFVYITDLLTYLLDVDSVDDCVVYYLRGGMI